MVSMATHYATVKNGLYVQNTHILTASHPILLNMVLNLFLDIAVYFGSEICKLSNTHIHEY